MNDLRANPAPLGLMGFGMTTILLNIHNAGFFDMDTMILAMGIFYGGLAQVFAGWMEYRRGDTFATTAFTSYGLFWLSLVYIIEVGDADPVFLGWYLFLWGVFTTMMFLGTLYKNRALQVVFASLAILFFLLAIGNWFDSTVMIEIAGWEGIFTGSAAMYLAFAEIYNDARGEDVVPVGVVPSPGETLKAA
jgi:succinate-acetate transporter protein